MKLFAVKSINGELYLPWVKGSNSKAELCPITEATPRLFKSYKGASQAMRSWAKGIIKAHGSWEYGDDGPGWFEISDIYVTPQRHRKLDDVCVVEVTMHMREIDRD